MKLPTIKKKGDTFGIQQKLTTTISKLLIISLACLGIIAIAMSYVNTNRLLEQTFTETAKIAASKVGYELQAFANTVTEIGCDSTFTDTSLSVADKQAIIDQKVETYDLERGNLLGTDGVSIFDGNDYSDRDYFKAAMNGETYISDPLISKLTGDLTIIVAAPIWKDGIPDTTVIGVVYIVPNPNFLNDTVATISVSKNSAAYMINKEGTTIANKNAESVKNQENTTKDAETDSSLKKLASLEGKMMKGESGFDTYRYNGKKKFLAYAPVPQSNDWSLAINAPTSDFMLTTILGIVLVIVAIIVSVTVGVALTKKLATAIANPIKECADRLVLLAEGDLNSPIPAGSSDDETGILTEAASKLVDGMNTIIKDIDFCLSEMAKGNFAVHSSAPDSYIGDFSNILVSLRDIKVSLTQALTGIKEAADQVAAGSGQLAESATDLATGATEQAGVVEELFATVTEVTNHSQENAKKASDTSSLARTIGIEARNSSKQMEEMNIAMQRISDTSQQINHIIANIDSIASQTNLLSLNASIEAARAGESGAGFAVVANEIGQLAKQSADAVENTRNLIQAALDEVANGTIIVEQTTTALNDVIAQIEGIVSEIEHVATADERQADSMTELNQGIEQISNVVENNSATAEECSATSEELSAQAYTLDDLIGHFTLSEE
ncbi:MAG TPA: methyl-accepting chemotaxis protein [Lachnospiraceae bacterium]|nr:methyl-accepting chemotaxis protein [Lachnospiraceae bacterium]